MMKKNVLAILHFNPIEQYPPIINLLNYLGDQVPSLQVHVFTNREQNRLNAYEGNQKNIRIHRFAVIDARFSLIKRYRNYFLYYHQTYSHLKQLHPQWVWYFETISALPASWYFNRSSFQDSQLLIHYHEYMTPREYKKGPLMVKWMHGLEKKLYKMVHCLSQTNEKRMEFFLQDNHLTLTGRAFSFPNYPLRNWAEPRAEKEAIDLPAKIVYVGAVGMGSLYIKEFCQWVEMQQGKAYFDIYSNQDTQELQAYLFQQGYRFTSVKGYIPYQQLPAVLRSYDVGVVLYNGHIPNYVYNAPNKLFEYLACGLDVWVPDVMKGSLPYLTKNHYPKVVALNFAELDKQRLEDLLDRKGLVYQPSDYFAESNFKHILFHGLGLGS